MKENKINRRAYPFVFVSLMPIVLLNQVFYTDEDLKWDTPLKGAFHSIHLSVTVALESLVGRLQASHYKSSRV